MSMNMNMNVLKEERNRGYLIAGIGAIVAFIAFFLPYFSISSTFGGSASFSAAQAGGILWLVFILILASIAASVLLIFRGNTPSPFGISGLSAANQIRYAVFGLIGAGALGIVCQLIGGFGGSYYGLVSAGPTVGFFLLLLGLLGIIGGGVFALMNLSKFPASSSQAFPPSQQWPSVQPPQWQQQYPPQYGQPSQQEPTQYAPPPQYGQPSQYGLPPQQYPPSQQYPPQYPPAQQPSEQQQQPPSQQPPWQ